MVFAGVRKLLIPYKDNVYDEVLLLFPKANTQDKLSDSNQLKLNST